MPLRRGLQVIVQHREIGSRNVRCRGFVGIPIVDPIFLEVHSPSAQVALEQALGDEVSRAIRAIGPGVRELTASEMPCRARCREGSCHALRERDCKKSSAILVLSGESGLYASGWRESLGVNRIPILFPPAGQQDLGPRLVRANAMSWNPGDPTAVTRLLVACGIASARPRLFISYVRRDSDIIAMQLFDALTRDGFDVFLDRFRIPLGADFPERLSAELSEKGTVLVLESRHIEDSDWVAHEVSFARLHRLALLALRLPGGHKLPTIAPSQRRDLNRGELTLTQRKLRSSALKQLIPWIRNMHMRGEAWRAAVLRDTMSDALLLAGVTEQRFADDTVIARSRSGTRVAVRLSTAPPTLRDFCQVDAHRRRPEPAHVVAPSRFANQRRMQELGWLEQTSNIDLWDESEILDLAGTLP